MTSHETILDRLLPEGQALQPVEEGLYRFNDEDEDPYEQHAKIYDAMIGNPLYNRIVWGNRPEAYEQFAREAIRSSEGALLDAGGGTLIFTADAFLETRRPVVVVDRSLAMLRRAHARLLRKNGRMPEHIVLVQCDLLALPFRESSFSTVLSLGLLHLFDDLRALFDAFDRSLAAGGQLYMTSLVAETRLARGYLGLLHRSGEVASPRSAAALKRQIMALFPNGVHFQAKKNMAYIQTLKRESK